MTREDKELLVTLLHKYMDEIIEQTNANRALAKEYKETGQYPMGFVSGLKSKYNHARILATKLSVDVNNSINPRVWCGE